MRDLDTRWGAASPKWRRMLAELQRRYSERRELDRWEGEGGAPEPAPVEREPQAYDQNRVFHVARDVQIGAGEYEAREAVERWSR